ncbi:hypothetical protein D3C81_2178810 [compost metagenome]
MLHQWQRVAVVSGDEIVRNVPDFLGCPALALKGNGFFRNHVFETFVAIDFV